MSIMMIAGIIFFIILYGAICVYIAYNFWVWLKLTRLPLNKWFYIGIMSFLSMSIILGQFITFQPLKWVGGYWMAILGYSLLILPVANIVILLLKRRGLIWVGSTAAAIFLFILVYGTYNAWTPVVRDYEVKIDKPAGGDSVRAMLVSDLHLGEIVSNRHLERLVEIVNEEKPDIILMPGDIIDDHIDQFIKQDMGETMARINAPLGVYVTSGNHDYYGDDLERMEQEMEKAGATVLRDETILVDGRFYLAGRNDKTDDSRKTVKEITAGIDHEKPVIMLDHQPYDFDIAAEEGVDLMVSGHTHKGQLAPAHLITERIYENDWGHLIKGDFHSVVSSGFGTWGPPLRIGSQSEVAIIKIDFGK